MLWQTGSCLSYILLSEDRIAAAVYTALGQTTN